MTPEERYQVAITAARGKAGFSLLTESHIRRHMIAAIAAAERAGAERALHGEPIETAPKAGYFLARNPYGEFRQVTRVAPPHHVRTVVHPPSGSFWLADRWWPLPALPDNTKEDEAS